MDQMTHYAENIMHRHSGCWFKRLSSLMVTLTDSQPAQFLISREGGDPFTLADE